MASLKTDVAAATRRSPSSSALPAAVRRSLIKKMERPSFQITSSPQVKSVGTTRSSRVAEFNKKEIAARGAQKMLVVNKSSKEVSAPAIEMIGKAFQPAVEVPAVPVPAESGLTLLELWKKRDTKWFQWELEFHEELFQNSIQEEEESKKKMAWIVIPVTETTL